MNPSDRLKVVKATSPSIRVSAAPQQNINVAKPGQNSQTLNVSGAAYKPTPQKSPDFLGGIAHGVGDFGAHIVSGLQQAGGGTADIGLQGSAVVNEIGRNLNPFINDQQRDAQRVADVRNIEAARNAIKGAKTVTGDSYNPYADYKPTGDLGKDFAQLAGRGLQTGLDATAFINPGRIAGKALLESVAKNVAKDVAVSSVALGGTQGVATGAQVYGQTGDVNKAVAEGVKSAVIATGAQGVLGTLGHVAGNIISKVGSPATKIARSTNAKSIDGQLAKLHPEIPDFERQVLSETLAGIKDKKRVQEILTSLDAAKEKIPVEKVLERGTETPAVNDNGTAIDRKKAAEAEAQQLAQQAADAKQAQTDATLAPAKDPNSIDYPTFQAQKDFEAYAAEKNKQLNDLINQNPDLTPQQIEAMKQAAADEIKKTFDEMQAGHAKSLAAEQNAPQASPPAKDVAEAAKVQSGSEAQTVNGDGSVSNAKQGDLPDVVGTDSLKQEALKYKSAEEFIYEKGLEHPEYKRRVAENEKYINEVLKPARAEANSASRAMQAMEKKYVGKKNLKLTDAEKVKIEAEYKELGDKVRKAQELEDNLPYNYPDEGINREKDLTDLYNQAHAEAKTPTLQAPKAEAPAQVAGDGSTTNAPQGDLPNEVGNNTPSSKISKGEKSTNAPSDGQTKITYETDPKTGKTVARTQEEIQNEINDITKIPRDKRTVAQAARLKELRKTLKNEDNFVDGNAPTVNDKFASQSDEFKAETEKMLKQLDENKGKLADQKKARKQETAQRAAAGDAAYDTVYKATGDVTAANRAKRAAQSGEKTKANITPVQNSDPYKQGILHEIQKSDGLFWERDNMQRAFEKMWGDRNEPLQDGDIKQIAKYYNKKQDGLGDDVETLLKQNKGTQSDVNLLEEIAGVPRTAMTIADASAPRQLAVSLSRHPIITTRNYIKSFADMFSSKRFDNQTNAIENATDANGHNYSEFMDTVMHLHLPNIAEKASEEGMAAVQLLARGKNVAKNRGRILKTLASPVRAYGHIVDASNRGMSSAIAHTRFELAKNFIDNAGGIEEVNRLFTPKELADLGEVLNTITGRGGKHGGINDKTARVMSNVLFSSRLFASRLNMLNPYWYFRLSGPARKEALSSLAAFSATLGATLTAISQADIPGVEVGMDPHSADFGKIKIGNTRYDISGGYVQYPRVLSQMLDNKKVNSDTGEEKDVTMADVAGGVAEGKLNPLLAFAWTIAKTLPSDTSSNPLDRKDEWGQDINLAQKAAEMTVPLNVSGMVETANDVGDPVLGTLMNLPSFFGAGVQTYGSTPSNLGTDAKNVTQAVNKISNDSKKATAQYKKTLSKEDLALVDLSEEKLNTLRDQGTIDQNRVDDILRKKKTLDSVAKGNKYDVPEGVKDPLAVQYYQKYNSMSKKDQEYWLSDKNPPDDFAKEITQKVNESRVAGLSEFKPSNALAKLYADYQKDLETSKDLTELDKVNKAKSFQSNAAKLNLNPNARDIYTEGSSEDLKKLIGSNGITKTDLEAAIQLDNELYTSGLSGSLKFSKKFRNSMGYATPPDPDGTGGSGGSGSTSAHLNDFLLPSSIGSAKSGIPTFSAKARTTKKLSVNSNLPGKATKKISIKL